MNAFDRYFQQLRQETLQLKTPAAKSAATIEMVSKSFAITATLKETSGGGSVSYQKWFKVNSNSSPLLFTAGLDKPYSEDDRGYSTYRLWRTSDGADIILVNVGGSVADWETIVVQGGSVTLNFNLIVTATDDFTLEEISA